MTDEPRDPDDERALDPNERWGQGTDESHPNAATEGPPAPDVPQRGADDQLGADDPDDAEHVPLT